MGAWSLSVRMTACVLNSRVYTQRADVLLFLIADAKGVAWQKFSDHVARSDHSTFPKNASLTHKK